MEPVVIAALINGPVTLAVGALTYTVGRAAARTAQNTAAETADFAYRATLEAAELARTTALEAERRKTQREAYANLVSKAHAYLRATKPILALAEELDEYAEQSEHVTRDDRTGAMVEVKDSGLVDSRTEALETRIRRANDQVPVLRAADVVILEGPHPTLTRAARQVKADTEALHATLANAGLWPWRQEEAPDPQRSAHAHATLEATVEDFTEAARGHLNGPTENGA
ncbi:hypothetical protein ACFQVC_34105 [Streptomyces monticola]|uniref:Uncharacterized protein n=1 Tax=Streptomyces monticola TaxID=2666263 RepID=A0ABW2JUH3_9ACTN